MRQQRAASACRVRNSLETVQQTTVETIRLPVVSRVRWLQDESLTVLSTIAHNKSRMAMILGDSGTRAGSHVPVGKETSMTIRVY